MLMCTIYKVLLTLFNVYLINYSGPGIKNPSRNRFHHFCKFRLDYVCILIYDCRVQVANFSLTGKW